MSAYDIPWRALADEYLRGPDIESGHPAYVEVNQQPWHDLLHLAVYPNVELVSWSFDQVSVTTQGYPSSYRWASRVDADDLVTSFEALQQYGADSQAGGQAIPLSDLHHDHPVFTRNDNLAFRAWHDTAHLRHGLSFSALDELRLFGKQAVEILAADETYAEAETSALNKRAHRHAAVDALFCESVYQLAACITLDGYPDRQYVRPVGPVGAVVRDLLIGLAS